MFLNYNLDIDEKSIWKIANPVALADPFPFSVNEVGVFYAKENYFTQRSEKNDYLLLFTTAGEGELSYGGQTLRLVKGNACLIDCNQAHSYRTAEGSSRWEFYWMHISSTFAPQYYTLLYEKSYRVIETGMDTELIDCFLRALDLIDYATVTSACGLSQCAGTLLATLVSLGVRTPVDSAMDQMIPIAVERLKEQHDQPIDLAQFASSFGLSKFYFIKEFSKRVGITPYRYLIMYRITRAKQLLRTTDYRAGDIARAVGFADESNFSRTFSRLTGLTPSQYRRSD